jgi:tetratricopeptide (TPR) repeat protein
VVPGRQPFGWCARVDAQADAEERQQRAEIARLRSRLQEHPDDAESWAKLGRAYRFDDHAATVNAFDHAARLEPNAAERWRELGQALWLNRADDAAESSKAALLSCLALDPQNGDCHYALGTVLSSQGDHAAAFESFTRAAEHGRASADEQAVELLELGDLEQSSAIVQAQLAQVLATPANVAHLYSLQRLRLRIALRSGDLPQAEAARQRLREYARVFPPMDAFHLGIGYAMAQPPEAVPLLRRFVESSCDAQPIAYECAYCGLARRELSRLAPTSP